MSPARDGVCCEVVRRKDASLGAGADAGAGLASVVGSYLKRSLQHGRRRSLMNKFQQVVRVVRSVRGTQHGRCCTQRCYKNRWPRGVCLSPKVNVEGCPVALSFHVAASSGAAATAAGGPSRGGRRRRSQSLFLMFLFLSSTVTCNGLWCWRGRGQLYK